MHIRGPAFDSRRDLIPHLKKHGCELLREGSNHSVFVNRAKRRSATVPRHRESNASTRDSRALCRPGEPLRPAMAGGDAGDHAQAVAGIGTGRASSPQLGSRDSVAAAHPQPDDHQAYRGDFSTEHRRPLFRPVLDHRVFFAFLRPFFFAFLRPFFLAASG